MKRLLCMLVLLATVIPAMAQKTSSRKVVYGGNASIGVNCGVSKDINSNSVSATTTHGVFLKDDLFLGLGTGINYELSGLIWLPIYAETSFNVADCYNFTPFLSCRIGGEVVALDVDSSRKGGGIMLSPAAGVSFGRYSFKLSYQYGAGSLYQKYDRYETLERDYELHYIGVSFQLNFGGR